jgi:Transcription elongation factor, GreA/GreB, C-term
MGGTTLPEQPVGMMPAHSAAPSSVRHEPVAALRRAKSTIPEFVVGAFEYAECKRKLDRLRAIRAHDVPDRMRGARGFVSADVAEEISHIQGDRLSGIASRTDPDSVSAGSPVGRAVIGRRAGDVVAVELTSGRVESLRVLTIALPAGAEA